MLFDKSKSQRNERASEPTEPTNRFGQCINSRRMSKSGRNKRKHGVSCDGVIGQREYDSASAARYRLIWLRHRRPQAFSSGQRSISLPGPRHSFINLVQHCPRWSGQPRLITDARWMDTLTVHKISTAFHFTPYIEMSK